MKKALQKAVSERADLRADLLLVATRKMEIHFRCRRKNEGDGYTYLAKLESFHQCIYSL